jgi:putative FmdB family regulatory protein
VQSQEVGTAKWHDFTRKRGLNSAFLQGACPRMPTYEYHCLKCDQNFEMFQSMRDKPLRECPKEHCRLSKWGHGKVKRLLGTGAGIIFKGSGFYTTDYRSKAYQEAAKKESPGSGEKAAPAKESNEPKPSKPAGKEATKSKKETSA